MHTDASLDSHRSLRPGRINDGGRDRVFGGLCDLWGSAASVSGRNRGDRTHLRTHRIHLRACRRFRLRARRYGGQDGGQAQRTDRPYRP